MFQDYRISFGEKNLTKNFSESRYRNEIPKAETPLSMLSEKRDSPCSDRMARGLELGCLIAIREYKSRSKIF